MSTRGYDLGHLQQAIDDLRFLEDEKMALEDRLRQALSMNHDLDKANLDLKDRLERMTVERDKYQAYAVSITTRLSVVSENIGSLIREAARHGVATAGHLQESRFEAERVGAHVEERLPPPVQAPQPRQERPSRTPHRVPPSEPHPHTAPPPRQDRPVERPSPELDTSLSDFMSHMIHTAPPVNNYP